MQIRTRKARPDGKLANAAVLSRIRELALQGSSLAQIRAHLALPMPEGFGLDASRQSIYTRLKAAGIQLQNESIAARVIKTELSPEALAVARRTVSAADVSKHRDRKPGRPESWLAQFSKEIVELSDAGSPYREIWDVLAARYPIVPQFCSVLTDKQKTDRLAVFILRLRKKQARKSARRSLLASPAASVPASQVHQATVARTDLPIEPLEPVKSRASFPTNTNIAERKKELAEIGDAKRATPEELERANKKIGLRN